MADSFDLWGASLCWGLEDAIAEPADEGAVAEKSGAAQMCGGSARDSFEDTLAAEPGAAGAALEKSSVLLVDAASLRDSFQDKLAAEPADEGAASEKSGVLLVDTASVRDSFQDTLVEPVDAGLRSGKSGHRDSLQDIPREAYILSTQDIDAHEASFDCGAQPEHPAQDSSSLLTRSATKPGSSLGGASAVPSAESLAPEESAARQSEPQEQPTAACDDTQIYVLPQGCLAGSDAVQTLAYSSPAVALEAFPAEVLGLGSPAQNAETLAYEVPAPASPLPSAAERAGACVDTLEYVAPTPPREKRAALAETLPYGLPDEAEVSPQKVSQPVATPVRKRWRSEEAQAAARDPPLPGRHGEAVPATTSGQLLKRARAAAAEEDSRWLVPVKRRRAGQPGTPLPQAAGLRPVLPPGRRKEASGSMPVPANFPGRQLSSARRQLTLAESLKRTSSVPRSCLSVDTGD